jgi:hypothetical protein
MSRIKEDKAIEDRISTEVIVDAYNEEERALEWYYYLEDKLGFPFEARCIAIRATSPLVLGEKVEVKKMAIEPDCEHAMLVMISWQGRYLAVPLDQLKPCSAPNETLQAITDWHYWIKRGYEF